METDIKAGHLAIFLTVMLLETAPPTNRSLPISAISKRGTGPVESEITVARELIWRPGRESKW